MKVPKYIQELWALLNIAQTRGRFFVENWHNKSKSFWTSICSLHQGGQNKIHEIIQF